MLFHYFTKNKNKQIKAETAQLQYFYETDMLCYLSAAGLLLFFFFLCLTFFCSVGADESLWFPACEVIELSIS